MLTPRNAVTIDVYVRSLSHHIMKRTQSENGKKDATAVSRSNDNKNESRRSNPPSAAALLQRSVGNQAIQELEDRGKLPRQARDQSENGLDGAVIAPDVVRRAISKPGKSMDESLQREMESKMGGDFSNVRIHTGPAAAAAADSINARAFTMGNHVAFNDGEYDPGSESGKKVLAHELTHVRQQTGGRVSLLPKPDTSHANGGVSGGYRVQPKLVVSSPDDPAEKKAEAVAAEVVRMENSPVEERFGRMPTVTRSAVLRDVVEEGGNEPDEEGNFDPNDVYILHEESGETYKIEYDEHISYWDRGYEYLSPVEVPGLPAIRDPNIEYLHWRIYQADDEYSLVTGDGEPVDLREPTYEETPFYIVKMRTDEKLNIQRRNDDEYIISQIQTDDNENIIPGDENGPDQDGLYERFDLDPEKYLVINENDPTERTDYEVWHKITEVQFPVWEQECSGVDYFFVRYSSDEDGLTWATSFDRLPDVLPVQHLVIMTSESGLKTGLTVRDEGTELEYEIRQHTSGFSVATEVDEIFVRSSTEIGLAPYLQPFHSIYVREDVDRFDPVIDDMDQEELLGSGLRATLRIIDKSGNVVDADYNVVKEIQDHYAQELRSAAGSIWVALSRWDYIQEMQEDQPIVDWFARSLRESMGFAGSAEDWPIPRKDFEELMKYYHNSMSYLSITGGEYDLDQTDTPQHPDMGIEPESDQNFMHTPYIDLKSAIQEFEQLELEYSWAKAEFESELEQVRLVAGWAAHVGIPAIAITTIGIASFGIGAKLGAAWTYGGGKIAASGQAAGYSKAMAGLTYSATGTYGSMSAAMGADYLRGEEFDSQQIQREGAITFGFGLLGFGAVNAIRTQFALNSTRLYAAEAGAGATEQIGQEIAMGLLTDHETSWRTIGMAGAMGLIQNGVGRRAELQTRAPAAGRVEESFTVGQDRGASMLHPRSQPQGDRRRWDVSGETTWTRRVDADGNIRVTAQTQDGREYQRTLLEFQEARARFDNQTQTQTQSVQQPDRPGQQRAGDGRGTRSQPESDSGSGGTGQQTRTPGTTHRTDPEQLELPYGEQVRGPGRENRTDSGQSEQLENWTEAEHRTDLEQLELPYGEQTRGPRSGNRSGSRSETGQQSELDSKSRGGESGPDMHSVGPESDNRLRLELHGDDQRPVWVVRDEQGRFVTWQYVNNSSIPQMTRSPQSSMSDDMVVRDPEGRNGMEQCIDHLEAEYSPETLMVFIRNWTEAM